MHANQPIKEFHPLCHEHHIGMEIDEKTARNNGGDIKGRSYACPEPDCLVHYNNSRGYFLLGQDGNLGMVPEVRCRQDGMPMYLAETEPEKRDFRLWRCPQCGGARTNGEDLIGGASREKYVAISRAKVGTAGRSQT